jgi:hypothetical protein
MDEKERRLLMATLVAGLLPVGPQSDSWLARYGAEICQTAEAMMAILLRYDQEGAEKPASEVPDAEQSFC